MNPLPLSPALVACPKCKQILTGESFNLPAPAPCPYCGALLQVEVFPALFRRLDPGRKAEAVLEESESSCFYHPQKKAVVPCEGCGRFLCALCDCELNGQHLCPSCLEIGRKKGKIKNLENHRTLWDSAALSLAILPMLIPYFTVVGAPMAIYLSIRHWKTPSSLMHRSKIRFVAALTLASLQVLGWIALILLIFVFRPRTKF